MNFSAFYKIIRPFNCIFVALTVLFGAFYKNVTDLSFNILAAVLTAVFIAASGYVINDYYDLEIDKINKPKRVLPSGKIKPIFAFNYSIILLSLGILFSFFCGHFLGIIIAITNALLLLLYAKRLKLMFFWGNLIVAYTAASTFIFGGLSNENVSNSLLVFCYAFLYTLIREIIKDLEDVEGDKSSSGKTLAIKFGLKKTVLVSFLISLLIIFLTFFSYYQGHLSRLSFILMSILVHFPLLFFHYFIIKNNHSFVLNKISTLMKFDMLLLLIIITI